VTRRSRLLVKLFFTNLLFISLCSSSVAAAQVPDHASPDQVSPRLAVFPFVSDELRLGVALADRLTHAFSDPGIPPELALGLVPPLVLEEGTFLSPLNLLGEAQTGTLHAATLLRETLGVETAVTGRVRYRGTRLELHLFVARAEGARSFLFRAPEAFPDRLISEAQAALSAFAGLTPAPDARLGLDLSSPYGTFIDGLINLGSGFPEEALPLLERAAAALSAEGRWQRRAAALEQLLSDRSTPARARYPLLAGVVALNARPFDEAVVARAFAGSELPLATLWGALLAAQSGDAAAARAGFAALDAKRYPFARVEQLLYRLSGGAAPGAVKAELHRLRRQQPDALSVLVGGLFVAQTLRDGALEQTLATRLTRLAPAFAYPYERLSQRAFDRNDPRAAAVALRTATRLEPETDLYWTNLGWAYYLLGVLGESEAASKRALELNSSELVALYNLGLVQVVTGRLEAALDTYAEASARDLEDDGTLDPAATADLRDALTRYPEVPGVHYALATLLEAGGDTRAAAAQYARYAERGGPPVLVAQARERARALQAPPPPLRIMPGSRVGVGPDALPFARYIPGDLLYARFELSTPGDELPLPLATTLRLRAADGTVVAESAQTERGPLPPATVALVIDDASLELPQSLAPGRYRLVVTVAARGREGRAVLPVSVAANTPPLVRQLLGRGITLRGLSAGLPLYEPEDASLSNRALLGALLAELSLAASAAETSPEVARGRFAGQRGAALFNASDAGDVRDFLSFLLQVGAGTDAPFAELYARWALEGAPAP
jgi:tetratricopeptide (TPR) repeat protein